MGDYTQRYEGPDGITRTAVVGGSRPPTAAEWGQIVQVHYAQQSKVKPVTNSYGLQKVGSRDYLIGKEVVHFTKAPQTADLIQAYQQRRIPLPDRLGATAAGPLMNVIQARGGVPEATLHLSQPDKNLTPGEQRAKKILQSSYLGLLPPPIHQALSEDPQWLAYRASGADQKLTPKQQIEAALRRFNEIQPNSGVLSNISDWTQAVRNDIGIGEINPITLGLAVSGLGPGVRSLGKAAATAVLGAPVKGIVEGLGPALDLTLRAPRAAAGGKAVEELSQGDVLGAGVSGAEAAMLGAPGGAVLAGAAKLGLKGVEAIAGGKVLAPLLERFPGLQKDLAEHLPWTAAAQNAKMRADQEAQQLEEFRAGIEGTQPAIEPPKARALLGTGQVGGGTREVTSYETKAEAQAYARDENVRQLAVRTRPYSVAYNRRTQRWSVTEPVEAQGQVGPPVAMREALGEPLNTKKVTPLGASGREYAQDLVDEANVAKQAVEESPVLNERPPVAPEAPTLPAEAAKGAEAGPSLSSSSGSISSTGLQALGVLGIPSAVGATLPAKDLEERWNHIKIGFGIGAGLLAAQGISRPLIQRKIVADFEQMLRMPTPDNLASVYTTFEKDLTDYAKNGLPGNLMTKVTTQIEPTSETLSRTGLRQGLAARATSQQRAEAMLGAAERWFDMQPKGLGNQFIDNFERGLPQATAQLQALDRVIRGFNDEAFSMVSQVKPEFVDDYIKNYFGRVYKDPKAASAFLSKQYRSLYGTTGFTRERVFKLYEVARKAGFENFSENPVTVMLARYHQQARFATMQALSQMEKEAGRTVFVKGHDVVPEGYERVNDRAFEARVQTKDGNWVTTGYHVLPEEAAALYNNYLSRSMWQGMAGYQGIRRLTQAGVQLLFGLSGFHYGMTGLDTIGLGFTMALKQAAQGDIKGMVAERAIGALAGGTAAAATMGDTPAEKAKWGLVGALLGGNVQFLGGVLKEGAAFRKAVLTGKQLSEDQLSKLSLLLESGHRLQMDNVYATQAIQGFWKNLREANPLGAAAEAPLALAEATAYPLMQWWVPSLKTGTMLRMISQELKPGGMLAKAESAAERQLVLTQLQDQVDDRLGQIVHDNLFWHKNSRDLAHIVMPTFGWNFGSARVFGGAVKDIAAFGGDIVRGKTPNLTYRAAYALGLPLTVGMLGGMMTYAFTGKPPEEPLDYFWPRSGETDANGKPLRLQIPWYGKDAWAYADDWERTILNKLNPLFAGIQEVSRNRDYYGRQIFDEDANPGEKAVQVAQHFAMRYAPISIQRSLQRPTAKGIAESILGFQQAPAHIGESPAEKQIYQYLRGDMPQRGMTPEEAGAATTRRDWVNALRKNDAEANRVADEMINKLASGELDQKEFNAVVRRASMPPPEYALQQHLTAAQTATVWAKATPEERTKWAPIIVGKILRAEPETQSLYKDKFNRVLEWYLKQVEEKKLPAEILMGDQGQ